MQMQATMLPLPPQNPNTNPKYPSQFEPDTRRIKQKLVRKGVFPTPKIVHALRKKEIQKANRKANRLTQALEKKRDEEGGEKPLSELERQAMDAALRVRAAREEYRSIMREFNGGFAGRPWVRGFDVKGLARVSEEYKGKKLRVEYLEEFREMLSAGNSEELLGFVGGEDAEEEGGLVKGGRKGLRYGRREGDESRVRMLVHRLNVLNLSKRNWKFSRLMSNTNIVFTEDNLLKIIEGLGAVGNWMQAWFVVEWEDYFLYPDMAAYHSIAVTLGQAGQVKELLKVIDYMRQRPSKKALNVQRKSWNPCLEPDVVIYNAVLNACVPCGDWKGVFWVLGQMRHSGLKPSGATYGLAMEGTVRKLEILLMTNTFLSLCYLIFVALNMAVLVSCLWAEGKVNEAVEAVEDMERRGVVGTASVYYELACCLCNNGRWKEAMTQIEKLKSLPLSRPLEVAFTGMIQSCMDGGYVRDGISIFENMQEYCTLNIGTINVMLKLYGCNDMFTKAKELFEGIKMPEARYDMNLDCHGVNSPDAYTYSLMLEASAISLQWEYFEHVYKEMALSGFQLDQNKHAWLLVEASRAGMMHLLEHAFDSALEAGELPHWSIFTEMICQTLICHDFKRAITLVNSMAHVSLQVSEKQWTNLFKRNSDKISIEELQKLRQCLNDKGLMSEPIVTNLSKSLCYLCGSNIPTEYALCDVTTKLSTFSEEDRDVSFNGDECFSLEENVEDIFDPLPELSRFRIDESGLDDYGSFEHAFEGSELPSASEILERWKEGEMKDANCTQSML
ncbi:hypothetical protein AMTRI_Chr12g271550 [Amborella trichopoda]